MSYFDFSKIDVEDYLNELGLNNVQKKGDQVWFSCPLSGHMGADKTPSASMELETTRMHCLAPETPVITKSGIVPIVDLYEKNNILMTTRGTWIDAPIKYFGRQLLTRLLLSRNGVEKEIWATPEHRWFVRLSSNRRDQTKNVRFTKNLSIGDRLSYSFGESVAKHGTIPAPFGVAHGFVFGDGYRNNRGTVAQFCGEKDNALLPFFNGYTILEVKQNIKRINGLPLSFKDYPSLIESPSHLYGWLSGYFAADGCVDKDGHMTIASAKRENLEFVRMLCNILRIGTYGIKHQSRLGCGRQKTDLYSMAFMACDLSKDFFILKHHKERWLRSQNRGRVERRGWIVKEIEENEREDDVFCAQVPKTHAFALEDNILTGNCFGCNFSGNAISFLAELEGVSPLKARKWLRERFGIGYYEPQEGFSNAIHKKLERIQKRLSGKSQSVSPHSTLLDEREVTKRHVDWHKVFDAWQGKIDEAYPLAYMLDRGFHPTTLDKWAIGWDMISQRISIPIRDEHNNLVGFKGRAVDFLPRYLVLGGAEYGFETYNVSNVLFGLSFVDNPNDLIVVEGELNCIAMHQKGYTNTVGISGKILSDKQVNLIKKYADSVTFIFDEIKDTHNAARLLREDIPTYITPPHDKDPADMNENDLNKLVTEARSAVLL